MGTTATHRRQSELPPFADDVGDGLLLGAAVYAYHHHIDRQPAFQTSVRQQDSHQFIDRLTAGFRFKHQTHRLILVRLIRHLIQHRQDQLLVVHLLRRQRLLVQPEFRISQFLNFLHDFLGRYTVRQFIYRHAPLTARQFLDMPARAHLQRTAPAAITFAYIQRGRDNLSATGQIGTCDAA